MVTLKESQSMVRCRSGDQPSGIPRVSTGTSAAVPDMDSGIKDTNNTKLCGVVTHWRERMPSQGEVRLCEPHEG